MHPSAGSTWDGADHIVRTKLTGQVSVADVVAWRRGLHDVVAKVPDGSRFRLLVNLVRFDPLDIAAHKAMRAMVPALLAQHGMRPAVLDLFDDEPELVVTTLRAVRCTACANVHHDATKMQHYQAQIGAFDQAFFSDLHAAEAWLSSAPR